MRIVGMFGIAAVALALCSASLASGPCCDSAKLTNAWCEKCNHGYIASVEVGSKKMYTALSGTPVDKGAVKCDGCKAALAMDGACDACHVQFVNGKMYSSPMAAALAHGKLTDPAKLNCEGCKKASADHGWCDACKGGMVGNVAFTDKAAYEQAVQARAVVVAAAAASKKCEGCAVAMVSDGKCESCKVAFKGGKTAKAEKP